MPSSRLSEEQQKILKLATEGIAKYEFGEDPLWPVDTPATDMDQLQERQLKIEANKLITDHIQRSEQNAKNLKSSILGVLFGGVTGWATNIFINPKAIDRIFQFLMASIKNLFVSEPVEILNLRQELADLTLTSFALISGLFYYIAKSEGINTKTALLSGLLTYSILMIKNSDAPSPESDASLKQVMDTLGF